MDWNQLRTILWLRWRLTRNQWSRGGTVNAVLSIIAIIFFFLLGAAGGIAGIIFGAFVLDDAKGITLLGVWDVIILLFLLFWLIGLVSEIQRSETIDIGKLLHLPVLLKDVFSINYIASHATLSIIIFAPLMLGLCIGLALGYSWMMIVMLPLVIGFIFMMSSWTYCLRGWLVTLMKNQRRRRTVIAVVTFCFLVITQLPNLLGNFYGHRERHRPGTSVSSQEQTAPGMSKIGRTIPPSLLFAHKIVPFLWVGNGAKSLTDNNPWAAVLGTAGTFGLGWLGIRRAYRTTIRFYQGAAAGDRVKSKHKKERTVTHVKNRLEESLPFVSDEASALALAFFQNLKRAPEIKMMLATNFLMLLFFCIMIFFRHPGSIGNNFKPFITVGVIMFSFFGLVQLMFNQFGYDRHGFRLLVLSPVSRKYILQGKNLSFLPLAMGIGGFLLIIVKLFLQIPIFTFLAAILQLITAYLLLSIVGNLVSIINPYRIAPGSMKPTKMSTLNVILLIMSNLLFSIAIIPIVIPPAAELILTKVISMPAGLFNLCLSVILLPVTVFFYKRSLTHLGILLQSREKKILEIVTREIE